jgi:hypothetical protein
MPAANVPLVIDQGEDFTAQVIWTDEQDNPQNLAAPMRLDIVGAGSQQIVSLTTPEVEPTEGEIPEITYSPDIGLIQLHIPSEQTASMPAGLYQYDLFVTLNDGDVYAGNQQFRLLVGQVIVNKRITRL